MPVVLHQVLPAETLVVAIDPGKVANRVWFASGERGLIAEPVSLPVLREGVDELERLVSRSGIGGEPLIAIEATGSLHRAWTAELERRFPGRVRLTVRRLSGSCGRGSVVPPRSRRWKRCSASSAIVASSSLS